MKLNLTPERIELIRSWAEPVATAKGKDRKVAQGILFSIGWTERKAKP